MSGPMKLLVLTMALFLLLLNQRVASIDILLDEGVVYLRDILLQFPLEIVQSHGVE